MNSEAHYDRRAGVYLEVMAARLGRLAAMSVAALIAIGTGYWYLQVVESAHYRDLAENNRLRRAPIQAPRGIIEDRWGRILVENVPSYRLVLDRSLASDTERSFAFASRVLELDEAVLRQRLEAAPRRERRPAIADDLDLSEVARFEAVALEYPEFQVEVEQRRLYRHGEQTAHLLGYLGEATEDDLRANEGRLRAGQLVGKEGVERARDDNLRGRDGNRELVVDSRNRVIDVLRRTPAEPGATLRLTIDLDLQQEAVELLRDRVGAIVALDPRDGAVRALVSQPSFDPNLFAGELEEGAWQSIIERPHNVLQNRAIAATYPPGSVFKIVVGYAGLRENVIQPSDRVFCAGSKRIYDRNQRCHKRGGHGWVDFEEAMAKSCDIYFYLKGIDLGIENIARYARLFGLGRASGVGLHGERPGLVPDPEWSRRVRGVPWYPGETVSVAIGQGPILVSPLQAAVMVAAVANGGALVKPHLVLGSEQAPSSLDLDPRLLDIVRRSLLEVVADGSGRAAAVAGIDVAGKSGTAQVIEQKTWTDSDDLPFDHRDHAWFASYAPYEDPELVVAVFVEHGGSGGGVAAPMAGKILEKYFRQRRQDS